MQKEKKKTVTVTYTPISVACQTKMDRFATDTLA